MKTISELSKEALDDFYKGDYYNALKIYFFLLSQNFEETKLHGNIAMTYEMLGEIELAVAHYKKSIRLDENNIRSINNLARVYITVIKDLDMASKYLDYAIKISPNDAEAYNLYGNICLIKDDYEIAEKYLKKSILLDKDFFKNYYDLACVYEKAGEKEKAQEAVNKCLELKPDFKYGKELSEKLKDIT